MKTLFISVAIAVSCMVIGTVSAQNSDISGLANENIEILFESRVSPYNWISINTVCRECACERVPSCLWDPEGNNNYCVPENCPVCGADEGRYCY